MCTFILVSALAEGADRLFIREAFEMLSEHGVKLHSVLPLQKDDYRRDFITQASRDEFEYLLRLSQLKTEMPRSKSRDEAYELGGTYVVDHSDVLIALWDGRPAEGRAGTAEIVGYARRQDIPVLVVPVRRVGAPDRQPHRPEWSGKPWQAPASTAAAYQRIEEYNRGLADHGSSRAQVEREEQRLGARAEGSPIHWRYEAAASWALPRFVQADSLAKKYQTLYYALGSSLLALAALAVAVVAAQSVWGWDPRVALIEVGCMLVLLAVYGLARAISVHDRWIGYRSLAEAFRSALFFVIAGGPSQQDRELLGHLCATHEPWFQRAFSRPGRTARRSLPITRTRVSFAGS